MMWQDLVEHFAIISANLRRIGPFFSAKVWRNGYFVVFLQPVLIMEAVVIIWET